MSDTQKKLLLKSQSLTKLKIVNKKQAFNKNRQLSRQDSLGAIEELVQCGICLEKMVIPKMLPCQHTFCLNCLISHYTAQNLFFKNASTAPKSDVVKCPICQKKCDLQNGLESINKLPKNLYIDSLLKLLDGDDVQIETKTDYRCAKCQTFSKEHEKCCQHCLQIFCNVCWNEHISELESNLSVLVKQIQESKMRLDHKLENLDNRCRQLNVRIKEAAVQKIELIKMDEEKVLKDVDLIMSEGHKNYGNIAEQMTELQNKFASNTLESNNTKVGNFLSFHRETSKLLSLVNHFGEAHVIFDPDSFRLEQTSEGIYSAVEEPTSPKTGIEQYKGRTFIPKLVWNKCPRPANVAICPWNERLAYIAATDTHSILILNRDRGKLQGRLLHPDMLYPQSIAFSKKHEEIYVSDKWKHCIHVFSKDGDYLRDFLSQGEIRTPDGIAMGPKEELVVCDSGNDRILIVNPQTGEHISTIGVVNNKTTLNMPTGVAVCGDKIIVADTGNHRIKIFYMDGRKLHEFGALGKGRGQFRSAEVVAVDALGFILVGDGGNARVQIFKADGTVVKIFGEGEAEGFGWISGICVTNEFDIIVCDSRNRCLKIF